MEKRYAILKPGKFETRESVNESGEKEMHLSGYFARFDDIYAYNDVVTESIAPYAFNLERDNDVRCLTNHDATLVLGRTAAGTMKLSVDEYGLRLDDLLINPKDQDAVNTWARVQRGDVSQCSFGFNILKESHEYRENGGVHYTLEDIELFEISVCTFPAYQNTSVEARTRDAENLKRRDFEAWNEKTENSHVWLKGETK